MSIKIMPTTMCVQPADKALRIKAEDFLKQHEFKTFFEFWKWLTESYADFKPEKDNVDTFFHSIDRYQEGEPELYAIRIAGKIVAHSFGKIDGLKEHLKDSDLRRAKK